MRPIFLIFAVFAKFTSSLFLDIKLVEFNEMAELHFARENSLTGDQWRASLPSTAEINEMRELVETLWSSDDLSSVNDKILDRFLHLKPYLQITQLRNFIVLHEIWPLSGLFARNWGYLAISHNHRHARRIQHSAAHFESDGDVCNETAILAEITESRSAVIAGASRYAVDGEQSPCQPENALCDAAHNNDTMFHAWNTIIADLSEPDDVFIQWHGMASTTCVEPYVDAFLSAGTGHAALYTENTSAVIISNTFNSLSNGTKISSTPKDLFCRLTAATNTFGRYLNGVPLSNVCTQEANTISGRFVHIEQKYLTVIASHSLWNSTLQQAFPMKV